MDTLSYILVFTFLGSVLSLIGGVILLYNTKFAIKISHFLASFAAGTLLGAAFFDLLPEASHEGGEDINVFMWTFIGLISFFLLERFISWFHHHHTHGLEADPVIPLVVFGDGVHNFIDGVAIASSFMINIPLGIATSLAVAAHEIPQEIGDFGILLHKGVAKFKVLTYNIFSALMAIVGALLTFYLAEALNGVLPILLALTAGFFIYIAASDLIPDIHNEEKREVAFIETVLLLLGSATIWVFLMWIEGLGLHG